MRVPLLNFEGGPGVLLLDFEVGSWVPFLNFEGGPEVLVPLLHNAQYRDRFSKSLYRNHRRSLRKIE